MGAIGCCDNRQALTQIDSPKHGKSSNKENKISNEQSNRITSEADAIIEKEKLKRQTEKQNKENPPPQSKGISIEHQMKVEQPEEEFILDKKPSYKRRKKQPENNNDNKVLNNTEAKNIEDNKPHAETVKAKEPTLSEIKEVRNESNVVQQVVPTVGEIEIKNQPSLVMKKENSNISGKNPYRKEKKSQNNETSPIRPPKEEQIKITVNDEDLSKTVNKSEGVSKISHELSANKPAVNNEDEEKNKFSNTVSARSQLFESKKSMESSNKPQPSMNDRKNMFESKLLNFQNNNTRNPQPKDSMLTSKSHNDIAYDGRSTFQERIRNMENSKTAEKIESSSRMTAPPSKFSIHEDFSESERKMLAQSLNNMRDTATSMPELDKSNGRVTRVKSLRISNMAKQLEKHLLSGDGKVNPEETAPTDDYENIINNKVSKARIVRRQTRKEFNQ